MCRAVPAPIQTVSCVSSSCASSTCVTAGAGNGATPPGSKPVAATGFEPGGVAPFPAPGVSQTLLARELLVHELVWIGAGSERHMAGLSPLDLVRLTRAKSVDLVE